MVINGVGAGFSEPVQIKTSGVVPNFTPSVKLRVLGSTSLRVDWEFLTPHNVDPSAFMYSIIVQKEGDLFKSKIEAKSRRRRSVNVQGTSYFNLLHVEIFLVYTL